MATIINKAATIFKPVSILIAEDDIDDQELLLQALHAINPGVNISFITNGNNFRLFLDGLEDCYLPKVILLDYNLPELSGVEILKLLSNKERYQPIPKLVWSTSNSEVFKNQSLQYGATDYIVKPTDFSSFAKIASKILSYL